MEVALVALLYVMAGGLVLAVVHLWVLAVVALLPAKASASPDRTGLRFIIVIPAHNEETHLPILLRSIRQLDYPSHDYQVWVVADNCDDATADIARSAGAYCLERVDPSRRGKGYALKAAFEQVLSTDYDAVVVVDADSTVSRNLLRAFAGRMASGTSVLQASYRLIPQTGPWSFGMAVENTLEDRLFYAAKERLGCTTLLRGNGMCIPLAVLRLVPFRCFSITEDVEYTVHLLRAGIRSRFLRDAVVSSDCPGTLKQLAQQRRRWSAGHFQLALREAPHLFALGLLRRDPCLCEFAVAVLLTSKSALAGIACIGLVASLTGHYALGVSPRLTWLFAGVLASICAYYSLGVALSRPSARQLVGLARLPLLAGWRLAVHVLAALAYRRSGWVRTSRT